MAASSDSNAMRRAQALTAHLTAAAGQRSATSADSNASPYVYTKDPRHVLSDEQRRHYDEHGFLLVKRIVSESEIGVWRDRFVSIANGDVDPTPTMLVMRDVAIAKRKEKGEHAITKLQDWQDDEVLFTYTSHPAVCKFVEAIIGSDFKSVHTMLINKPPDVGGGSSRHPPHQDL
jgi:phytanoyl-CoA hydroxylase